jgi:hypothetical protein
MNLYNDIIKNDITGTITEIKNNIIIVTLNKNIKVPNLGSFNNGNL